MRFLSILRAMMVTMNLKMILKRKQLKINEVLEKHLRRRNLLERQKPSELQLQRNLVHPLKEHL